MAGLAKNKPRSIVLLQQHVLCSKCLLNSMKRIICHIGFRFQDCLRSFLSCLRLGSQNTGSSVFIFWRHVRNTAQRSHKNGETICDKFLYLFTDEMLLVSHEDSGLKAKRYICCIESIINRPAATKTAQVISMSLWGQITVVPWLIVAFVFQTYGTGH